MDVEQNKKPLVTVVSPTRNRVSLLQMSLECVWRQTIGPERIEIVVVDNYSTDDTARRFRELAVQAPCRMRYHRMESNRGPAAARNAGAALGEGEFIAFLDSDVQLKDDWLQTMLDLLQGDRRIGIGGGKLLFAPTPDRVNAYGGAMTRIGFAWDAHEGDKSDPVDQPMDCLWVPTAAAMMRRSLFESLGGFDEAFYACYEDVDLGWRANLAGYRSVCIPDAVTWHHIGARVPTVGDTITYHYCKNRLRTMLKNYGVANLVKYVPIYTAYALVDAVLRRPRIHRLKALLWNVIRLRDTLRSRSQVQRGRTVSDAELGRLFTPEYFPSSTVARRRKWVADNVAAVGESSMADSAVRQAR
ncbi:MAG: glycosyltransferase family 2 protein [Phycisphaerae bacterium]